MAVLRGMGEDCRGLVAVENAQILGWILYVVLTGPYGTVVTSLPYLAYGGPAVPNRDSAVLTSLLRGLREEAESIGADVLTIGTSPFLSQEIEAMYRTGLALTHELENFVQIQNLVVHPLDQLATKRRKAIRSEIRRAARHGLRVIREMTPAQFQEWLAIYRNRYKEIRANPYPDQFHRLAFALGVPAKLTEFWGVLDGDRLVGGVMFTISRYTVEYFSSAFETEYRHLCPSTFLLNEAFNVFLGRGVRHFNWQSSPSKDGVYKYKARWGARESRHYYMSALLRPSTSLLKACWGDVRRAYPFRFVLPYSELNPDPPSRFAAPITHSYAAE